MQKFHLVEFRLKFIVSCENFQISSMKKVFFNNYHRNINIKLSFGRDYQSNSFWIFFTYSIWILEDITWKGRILFEQLHQEVITIMLKRFPVCGINIICIFSGILHKEKTEGTQLWWMNTFLSNWKGFFLRII